MFDFDTNTQPTKNTTNGNKLTKDFSDYLGLRLGDGLEKNALSWWKKHKHQFPLLSQVVQMTFCCPATSVPSEILTSSSGYTVWDRRNSLSPVKLNKMMVCQHFDKNIS